MGSGQPPLHISISEVKTPGIQQIIQSFYDADPRSIHQADGNGFIPVHCSLGSLNIYALRKLLELGATEDLQNYHNVGGVTPYEILLERMRSSREFCETMMGIWNGHEKNDLMAEYYVKRALGEIGNSVSEVDFEAKRKWGCTCGACLGGYMSPRMCFRINRKSHCVVMADLFNLWCRLDQGALMMDMMEQNMDTFRRGKPLGDPNSLFDNSSDYLPRQFRSSMYKTFYKGYQALFNAIYVMTHKPIIPLTVANLASFVVGSSDVSFYLNKGGRYEYALDAVTSVAREQSCLGDGTFEELYEDEAEVGTKYTGLPRCANDLEFELVRRLVGLDPNLQWGPHYDLDEEDLMDIDGVPPEVQRIIDMLTIAKQR